MLQHPHHYRYCPELSSVFPFLSRIVRSLEYFADHYDVKPIHYELLLCIENVNNWLHLSDRESRGPDKTKGDRLLSRSITHGNSHGLHVVR